MSVGCRLGIHKWGPWRSYSEITHHVVRNVLHQRVPDEDFVTSRQMQRRDCRLCGLREKRDA